MDELHFYRELPVLKLPLTKIFQYGYFCDVPSNWHIIISDVKNSTEAVYEGRHNDVNLVAAGSLIAGLNVAKKCNVEVPFFFGGDGSTLLVPEQLLRDVLAGLAAHNRNSFQNFGLAMHIGNVPMKAILQTGHSIKIAKLEIDSVYSKAIIIGDGLQYAEQAIKQALHGEPQADLEVLNLTGLECRWNKVKPPAEEAENVCFLIEAVQQSQQLFVYTQVLLKLEEVYGDMQKRNPLSPDRLKPLVSFQKLKKEMLAKFGRWKRGYFLESFLRTFFGTFFFKFNWRIGGVSGKEYLAQLIAHADTLTVDGRINTIICGTREKHGQFLHYLSQQEREGVLLFGHHVSKESIMTCYIEERNAKHIHFVDGADGGYTEAAKEFKKKRRQFSKKAQ